MNLIQNLNDDIQSHHRQGHNLLEMISDLSDEEVDVFTSNDISDLKTEAEGLGLRYQRVAESSNHLHNKANVSLEELKKYKDEMVPFGEYE